MTRWILVLLSEIVVTMRTLKQELAEFGTAAVGTYNDLVSWIKKRHTPSQTNADLPDTNFSLYRFEYERLASDVMSLKLRERDASVDLPSTVDNETISVTRVGLAKYEIEVHTTRLVYDSRTLEYDNIVTYRYYVLSTRGRDRKVSMWYEMYDMTTAPTYATWQELRELYYLLPMSERAVH